MPFQIRPIREFLVRPSLPPALSRLAELAYNLVWSWEPMIRALFRRLDPALWRESGYNPVVLLGSVSQSTLDRAAADPRYVTLYSQACERYDALLEPKSFVPALTLTVYFSAEYGLTECRPIYSSGLARRSGGHRKTPQQCG